MKKGLMLFHDDMEDVEAIATRSLLRRNGFKIDSVSVSNTKSITMFYGTKVEADFLLDEININNYSFIIIPGGMYVKWNIKEDKVIKPLINEFYKNDKGIFAICAGPRFLGELNILKNITYTIFPGCERDYYGGNLTQDKKVVRDGNIITARSVGALFDFVSEIIKFYKGDNLKEEFLNKIYYYYY